MRGYGGPGAFKGHHEYYMSVGGVHLFAVHQIPQDDLLHIHALITLRQYVTSHHGKPFTSLHGNNWLVTRSRSETFDLYVFVCVHKEGAIGVKLPGLQQIDRNEDLVLQGIFEKTDGLNEEVNLRAGLTVALHFP